MTRVRAALANTLTALACLAVLGGLLWLLFLAMEGQGW